MNSPSNLSLLLIFGFSSMKTDHHLKVFIYFLILKEGDFRAPKKSGKGDLVSATCVKIKTRATVSGLSNSTDCHGQTWDALL